MRRGAFRWSDRRSGRERGAPWSPKPPPHPPSASPRPGQLSPFTPGPRSRTQREQIEKERLEAERKAAGRLQHADELRRQVRESQQKQVQERISTFEEGRRLEEEARRRSERISAIKKQMVEELRCAVGSSSALPQPLSSPPGRPPALGKLGLRDWKGLPRCWGCRPLQRL